MKKRKKNKEGTEVVLRRYSPKTDDNYIYSTWTKSLYCDAKGNLPTSKHEFFQEVSEKIKSCLAESVVRVACLKDDPYVIMGYVVIRQGKKEWICVKKDYLETGIIDLLMRDVAC